MSALELGGPQVPGMPTLPAWQPDLEAGRRVPVPVPLGGSCKGASPTACGAQGGAAPRGPMVDTCPDDSPLRVT